MQGTRARGGDPAATIPSLAGSTAKDNLQVTLDFRRVYASLLERWLGTGADEVIPNASAFRRLALVR